jgi:hypothetical protein
MRTQLRPKRALFKRRMRLHQPDAYSDGLGYRIGNSNFDPLRHTDHNGDSHSHGYADAYSHGDTDANAYSYDYTVTDGDAECHTNQHPQRHTEHHSHGHSERYAKSDSECHAFDHPECDTNTEFDALDHAQCDTERHSDRNRNRQWNALPARTDELQWAMRQSDCRSTQLRPMRKQLRAERALLEWRLRP